MCVLMQKNDAQFSLCCGSAGGGVLLYAAKVRGVYIL